MKPVVTCMYRKDTEDNKIFCEKHQKYIKHSFECSKEECKDCKFPILANVVIKVGRCDECPFCKTKRTIGAGDALDFHCQANGGRLIDRYIEYMSELNPVPDWCPFYIKKQEA